MKTAHSYITAEECRIIKVLKDDGSSYNLFNNDIDKNFIKKYTLKSLLRYPGGKTRAVNLLLTLIPKNTNELCSPFGSVK